MSTVRVPPVLRQHTGGAKEVEVDGATAGQVLEQLGKQYPAMREQLFHDGDLQRFINVYVNDEDIQYLDKLNTPVGSGDTVIILPAMAGGR